jgi:acyl transferase domain-containing protein/NAD(P)-dependent dehydrogenase (short-subunit alcohol dehydrogenase family)/acyl-CoA thioesterase FadM
MYYVVPYRVLFHDTMAYGTHHFLTNLKFQCEAREHFLFAEIIDRLSPEERRSFDDVVFLTRDVFSRNLGSVPPGERVAILMSVEEPTLISVRFCFRVFGSDGRPITCGFQTAATVSARTHQPIVAPPAIRRCASILSERLSGPDFKSRVLAGNLAAIFTGYAHRAAAEVLAVPEGQATARLVRSAPWESASTPERIEGSAFLLPGNGSLKWTGLKSIVAHRRGTERVLQADEIVTAALGCSMSRLADVASEQEFKEVVRAHPGLDQATTYVASVLAADILADMGVMPDVVVGHSGGELSALAVAGAYPFEVGLDVVCQGITALAPLRGIGGMLALSVHARRVESLISALGSSQLQISVINRPEQTIVSGPTEDIARLRKLATHLRIATLPLPSAFPFHSSLLQPAVQTLAAALGELTLGVTKVPVYSPLERDFYGSGRLADIVPLHFVRRLDYRDAILRLHDLGISTFVDCSTGATLKSVVGDVLASRTNWNATFPFKNLMAREPQPLPSKAAPHIEATPHVTPLRASECGRTPIAIVGLGCVLPGAGNADELWDNVKSGQVSIVDLAALSPLDAFDFLSRGKIVSDKTYSSLSGQVAGGSYTSSNNDGPLLAERILTDAVTQALARTRRVKDAKVGLFVGSTADGYFELDEALVAARLVELAGDSAKADESGRLTEAVDTLFGREAEAAPLRAPSAVLERVARAICGPETEAVAIDAACASSLYAIQLGMEQLQDGQSDFAICGGVFASGPANNCLFSQFGGLSATGSRPFDSAADGVVFSPGAAVVALKRLDDALRDGDHIEAVIRGCGTSSDGKGASVIEPKKAGQVLAIRRAYAGAEVDPATVQYVEAHATATRVGDAIEFAALNEVFEGSGRPISIGSIKAMIGHTGWAAGAASVVKVCLALKHGLLPPQANFSALSPDISLDGSPFAIPTCGLPWTREDAPRRAGVNAFGFGGANSHLIVEEFDPEIHTAAAMAKPPLRAEDELVVVAIGAIDPQQGALAFGDEELNLPQRRRVLPDVLDSMDRSQLLAIMAADQTLSRLGGKWQDWRNEIGIVFGFEGKTDKSMRAAERIYLDRITRQLSQQTGHDRGTDASIDELASAMRARTRPSGPYTLPGLMPNLITGRVANMFDLRGANFVIDTAGTSLASALRIAASKVRRGESKMILAGGLSANPLPLAKLQTAEYWRRGRPIRESAIVLALVRSDFAREVGLKPIATLRFDDGGRAVEGDLRVGSAPEYLMGAEGAHELRIALDAAEQGDTPPAVCWQISSDKTLRLNFAPVERRQVTAEPVQEWRPTAPVEYCSIVLKPAARPVATVLPSLRDARVVVICDQREALSLAPGPNWTFVSPPGVVVFGARQIEPLEEEELVKNLANSLNMASLDSIDAVILAKDLGDEPVNSPLAGPQGGSSAFDLFIAVTRLLYDQIGNGRTSVLSLCGGAWGEGALHPWTGLCGGVLKSLARELPESLCRAIHTDEPLGLAAMEQLCGELSRERPHDVEVVYRHGVRHVPTLLRMQPPSEAGAALNLDEKAVVLATGGARGITAKFVEAILEHTPCRIVLWGRARLGDLPHGLKDADKAAVAEFERQFYATGLLEKPTGGIKILKQRFKELRDAWEMHANLKTLRSYGVAVEYMQADVTDPDQVNAAVVRVKQIFGRLDMIIHGAGIQDSRPLKKKSLLDFRRVLSTKVDGLFNLQRACVKHFPDRAIHYHLVTSAFSFFGNDGQTDYGAANEMLNRMAAWHCDKGESWSALAWLGWAGVGMTSGAEYRPLAERRGLRPIFAEEGKTIFATFMAAPAYKPVTILVSEGESRYFGVPITQDASRTEPTISPGSAPVKSNRWEISVNDCGAADHLVRGLPTLPGALALDIAVRSAACQRKDLPGVTITDVKFQRFVTLQDDKPKSIILSASPIRNLRTDAEYHVEMRSDFVHSSGTVLQRGLLHFACRVHLTSSASAGSLYGGRFNGEEDFVPIPDPYSDSESPVFLSGPFRCLHDIRIGNDMRTATFHSQGDLPPGMSETMIPCILLDALCRLSMLHVGADGSLPICVASHGARVSLAAGANDAGLVGEEILLWAGTPSTKGEFMFNSHAQAVTRSGRVLVTVEDLTAKVMGVVMWKRPKRNIVLECTS